MTANLFGAHQAGRHLAGRAIRERRIVPYRRAAVYTMLAATRAAVRWLFATGYNRIVPEL
jgi:hypothetical protein